MEPEELLGLKRNMLRAEGALPVDGDASDRCPSSRTAIVQFLTDLACEHAVCEEAVHLAVRLSDAVVFPDCPAAKLRLRAAVCLWLSHKWYDDDESYTANFQAYLRRCGTGFGGFVEEELRVLDALGFRMGHPTSFEFLEIFLLESDESERVRRIARFVRDVSCFDGRICPLNPSLAAAAFWFSARACAGEEPVFRGDARDITTYDRDRMARAVRALFPNSRVASASGWAAACARWGILRPNARVDFFAAHFGGSPIGKRKRDG